MAGKADSGAAATQKDIGITPEHNASASGFEKPSQEAYNTAHGRVPSAPTVGGDSRNRSPKGMPPGAPSATRAKPID